MCLLTCFVETSGDGQEDAVPPCFGVCSETWLWKMLYRKKHGAQAGKALRIVGGAIATLDRSVVPIHDGARWVSEERLRNDGYFMCE